MLRRSFSRATHGHAPLLDRLSRAARAGGWLEVLGLPGVGKSRLLRDALRLAPFYQASELRIEDLVDQLGSGSKPRASSRLVVVVEDLETRPELIGPLDRWRRKRRATLVAVGRRPCLAAHGVSAETFRIPPLAVPSHSQGPDVAAKLPSVRLFCEAAGLPRPSHEAVQLVRASEGIPLVLELFAAQAHVRPLKTLAAEGLEAIREDLAETFGPFLCSLDSDGLLDLIATCEGVFDEPLLWMMADHAEETKRATRQELPELVALELVETSPTPRDVPPLRFRGPMRVAWLAQGDQRTASSPLAERYRANVVEQGLASLGENLVGPDPLARVRLLDRREALDAALQRGWASDSELERLAIARASLVMVGAPPRGAALVTLDAATRSSSKDVACRALIAKSIVRWFAGEAQEALELGAAATKKAPPGPLLWMARLYQARFAQESNEIELCRSLLDGVPDPVEVPMLETRRLATEARYRELIGDLHGSRDLLLEQRRVALRHGDAWSAATADIHRARSIGVRTAKTRATSLRLYRKAVTRLETLDPHYAQLFLGILASTYLELGDPREADRLFRRVEPPVEPSVLFEARFAAHRAAALMELGDVAQASLVLESVEDRLEHLDDEVTETALEVARRLVEDIGEDPLTDVGRDVDRMPEVVRPVAAVALRLAGSRLRPGKVAVDGGSFETAVGTRVSLDHRPALQRVVSRLARSAGKPVPRGALFEAGWPGDESDKSIADVRVRTTISQLRTLGLDTIETTRGGYVLPEDAVESASRGRSQRVAAAN